MKKSGRLIVRLLLTVLATGLTLALAECAFRVKAAIDDSRLLDAYLKRRVPRPLCRGLRFGHIMQLHPNRKIIYELRPDTSYRWVKADVTINRAGFRGKAYPTTKQPNAFRIVGLGDSVMWGWGVGDAQTYLAILEKQLNEKYPDIEWETVNSAVPGHNTVMEIEVLKVRGMEYDPDLVILNYVANDFDLPPFFRPRRDYYTTRISFLREYLHGTLENVKRRIRNDKNVYAKRRGPTPDAYKDLVGWEPFVNALRELKRLGEAHGFHVLIIALEGHMPANVEDVCRNLSLPYFYPFDAYSEKHEIGKHIHAYLKTELYLSRKDPHPSAKGHAFTAEQLLGYIETNLIAKGP